MSDIDVRWFVVCFVRLLLAVVVSDWEAAFCVYKHDDDRTNDDEQQQEINVYRVSFRTV